MPQDNRTPNALKKPTTTDTNRESNYLAFADWIHDNRDIPNTGWITIADLSIGGEEHSKNELLTFSALGHLSKAARKHLLSRPEEFFTQLHWDTFAGPSIVIHRDRASFIPGGDVRIDGIRFSPLVFYRHHSTPISKKYFELSQDLILLYNLYFDAQKGEYLFTEEETGDTSTVAKLEISDDRCRLIVNVVFLRKYLSLRNLHLARFHYHDRAIPDECNAESIELNIPNRLC